jgi:hypothetical protein
LSLVLSNPEKPNCLDFFKINQHFHLCKNLMKFIINIVIIFNLISVILELFFPILSTIILFIILFHLPTCSIPFFHILVNLCDLIISLAFFKIYFIVDCSLHLLSDFENFFHLKPKLIFYCLILNLLIHFLIFLSSSQNDSLSSIISGPKNL